MRRMSLVRAFLPNEWLQSGDHLARVSIFLMLLSAKEIEKFNMPIQELNVLV